MRNLLRCVVATVSLIAFAVAASGEDYQLTDDSLPREGVPRGTITKHTWDNSQVFPGTIRDYWIYVPSQYDDAEPACVMVFQDGGGYVDPQGPVRVPTVFDNLIHTGEMPITIGIFINPGQKEGTKGGDQRSIEYDTLSDRYARFLLEEILPRISQDYNLVKSAAGRAIAGISSGGICAFTVAWERPDAFAKVVSHVGSFTNIRGGHGYPSMIRKTRGNPKPIRIFMQDGEHDLNIVPGDWTLANLQMESALKFARYDYRFEMGNGGHNLYHGGAIFPETLRWLWRDYPGVRSNEGAVYSLDSLVGQWHTVTNTLGEVVSGLLTITKSDGAIAARITAKDGSERKVSNLSFADGILSFEFPPGKSQKLQDGSARAWLRVTGNTFEGPIGNGGIDFAMKGRKIVPVDK